MKKLIPALLCLFFCAGLYAQDVPDSLVIKSDSIKNFSDVERSTFMYIDSFSRKNLEALPTREFKLLAGSKYSNVKVGSRLVNYPVYLLFSLQNNTPNAGQYFFFPGMLYDGIRLFEKTVPGTISEINYPKKNSGFVYLEIPAGARKTFLVKLDFAKIDFNRMRAVLVKAGYLEYFKLELTNGYEDNKIASYILSGVLLMMILFALVNYFLNKKSEFLYYCFYAGCMFFLIFFSSYLSRKPGLFTAFFRSYFDFILLMIGTIFYLVFVMKFINTRNNHRLLDKLFRITCWILVALMFIFTWVHFATHDVLLGKILENSMKILAMIVGTVFIVMGLKTRDKLIKYLAVGSACQIFFAIISLVLIFRRSGSTTLLKSALFYFEVSIVMAIFFFLLGLTYKNRRDLIEKTQEQEAMKLEVEKKGFETQLAVIKAQQEERNRISADMHDDLGAGMTTIRLFSELAKTKMGDKIIPEIEKISTSADELLNKMNAIIWSMSSSNDTLGNMIAYIRSYALGYFENTGIDCNINIPERLPELEVAGEIRRNIFLVVKEALNNIVKHSGASAVKIEMQKEKEGLALLIHDNGRGIDTANMRMFGNGLKNMKKRMDDVDMEFSIQNDNGTLIRLYRKTRG